MFQGEYQYRIDPKGRVPIPPKFKSEFKGGIVLARGFDRCIIAYPQVVWEEVAKKFDTLPITRSKQRRIHRAIFSTAFSLELDAQGRVLLPPPLREYAQISEAAVITGVNKYLEIWSKELWDKELDQVVEEAWQLAEGMDERQ